MIFLFSSYLPISGKPVWSLNPFILSSSISCYYSHYLHSIFLSCFLFSVFHLSICSLVTFFCLWLPSSAFGYTFCFLYFSCDTVYIHSRHISPSLYFFSYFSQMFHHRGFVLLPYCPIFTCIIIGVTVVVTALCIFSIALFNV